VTSPSVRNGIISFISLIALVLTGLALGDVTGPRESISAVEYLTVGGSLLWFIGAGIWVARDRYRARKN
jgi:hypothetical protein